VLNCILVYKIRIECVFRTCWRSTALIAAAKKVASTKQRSKRARINFCRSPSHIYGRGTYKTSSIEFSLGPPHGSPAPLTGLRPSPLRGGGKLCDLRRIFVGPLGERTYKNPSVGFLRPQKSERLLRFSLISDLTREGRFSVPPRRGGKRLQRRSHNLPSPLRGGANP
jgi:hypothetical protein